MIERPTSENEVAELVRKAADAGTPLAIKAGGTRGIAHEPAQSVIDTTRLTGVTLYEPAEMVVSARAGTPLAEVEAMLASEGQMLPFDPMDHRTLLGTQGTPTIGAVAACNISGSRRVSAGAARDHLIGIRMANGHGEIVKSGGRVMKNVTGLDLVKLNAGAMGTLGVLTEVTFKVLPVPQMRITLRLEGLTADTALEALAEAMATPFEVSAAAHLPGTPSMTLVRLEGFNESCRYRFERLAQHLAAFAPAQEIADADEEALWTRIRDAHDLADAAHVLRVHTPPSRAGRILSLAREAGMAYTIDWAGGLIWLGLEEDQDVASTMRDIAASCGHPRCVRSTRPAATLLPAAPALQAIGQRVKLAFDPRAIFNPDVLAGHI